MEIKFNPKNQFPGRGPCIEMIGDWVTPEVHDVVSQMLGANHYDDPAYQARIKAHAFFQGGYDRPDGQWILLEFWATEEACADFVKLLNERINEVIDEKYVNIMLIARSQNDKDIADFNTIIEMVADETKCELAETKLAQNCGCRAMFIPKDNVEYRAVSITARYTFNEHVKQRHYIQSNTL